MTRLMATGNMGKHTLHLIDKSPWSVGGAKLWLFLDTGGADHRLCPGSWTPGLEGRQAWALGHGPWLARTTVWCMFK